MPVYRFARYIVTAAIDVTAESPQAALALLQKDRVEAKGDFAHTVIEELALPLLGYREQTSADLLGALTRDRKA